MFSLGFPYALLLLPLPWLVWRFAPPFRDRTQALRIPFFRQLAREAGLEPKQGAVILKRTRLQMIAAVIAWGLTVIALARPVHLGEPVVFETSARDMMLAIDLSGSMDDADFIAADGSRQRRIDAVKGVVADFIAGRDGDRIGLIVFGTRAFVQAPFTEDLESLTGFLDQIEVGMAGPNTAIGDAIGLAIRSFQTSEVEERLLILLSDGADTGSRMSPVNAAEIAAGENVGIYTIGVGDPEASGEDRVDLDALKDIAARAGGQFFYAGDENALSEIYARIDELNPRATETETFQPREQIAHIPLSLALLIILGALVALDVQRRKVRG